MSARIMPPCLLAAVLALGLWGCGGSGAVTASVNEGAALTGNLPWNPLQWKVITSSIDKRASTMSTLYGNDVAVQYARRNQDYPAGAVLSLVTWTQRDDPRWFGGRIPGRVKSVEFLSLTNGPENQPVYSYEEYQGSPLLRQSELKGHSPGTRAAQLLSLRAAVLP